MAQRPELPDYDPVRLEHACAALGIRLLILFGSRATGSPPPEPESDLDLAIALRRDASRHDLLRYITDLSAVFPRFELDVALIADADPLFRWEIMDGSVLLYGDDLEYLELNAFAYRDFVDSADLRALERTLSERKLAHVLELIRAPT